MSRKRSSHPSNAELGFTLIELLVAASIGTLIMGTVVNTLLSTTRYRREIETRLETHQGLNAAIDALTRDIRLAGACMPTVGDFVALESANGTGAGTPPPNRDMITARIGIVDAAGGCIRTTVRSPAKAGATVLDVEGATGFARNMRIYLAAPNGVGEFVTLAAANVSGTDPSTDTLQLRDPLGADYDAVSGVFAVQERAYQIAEAFGVPPSLRLAIDGGEFRPMALGIYELDLEFTLRQNCPKCEIVPPPTTDEQWRLVTDVRIDLAARLKSPLTGQIYTVEEGIRVKPRNLLPPT
jgi:type II secretory pathway pseudopilin PulG